MEVVKGAAAPLAPGTEAWWRAAVREAVYALRHKGLVQRRRGGQLNRPVEEGGFHLLQRLNPPHPPPVEAKPPTRLGVFPKPSLVHRRRPLHIDVLNAHVDGRRTPSSPPPTRDPPAPALFTASTPAASTLNAHRLFSSASAFDILCRAGRLFELVARGRARKDRLYANVKDGSAPRCGYRLGLRPPRSSAETPPPPQS